MKHKRLISLVLAIMLIALNVIGANADFNSDMSLEEIDLASGLNAFDDRFIPDEFLENTNGITPFATQNETEPNNTIITADVLNDDDNMSGTISSGSDVDYFVLENSGNGAVSFWINASSPTQNTYLNYMVLDSSGNTVAYTSNTKKLVVLPERGSVYYIRVYSNSSSAISYTLRAKHYPYSAAALQGDTESPSDCDAFLDAMSENNYAIVAFGYGSEPSPITENQFVRAKEYTVAYYSGHGSTVDGGTINSESDDSSKIKVSEALNVDTSSWETSCFWQESDPIRVLVLASCFQLDSSCVSTYAKIMKASGIRAIAGYHSYAPVKGDDTIAASFVEFAETGESIKSSWRQANYGQDWAVLVYEDGANQFYRLPGFPGKTYPTPSDSTPIYRYANFIDNTGNSGRPVTTSISSVSGIPATLAYTDKAENRVENVLYRDSAGVAVDEHAALQTARDEAQKILTEDELQVAICVESSVIKELVDTEVGIVEGTATTVEKGYTYYDTYSGIKLADSFISIGVDSDGITGVVNSWKDRTIYASATNMVTKENIISTSAATHAALRHVESIHSIAEVTCENLTYVPVGNNIYQLCYEIITPGGTVFVNVLDGTVIESQF